MEGLELMLNEIYATVHQYVNIVKAQQISTEVKFFYIQCLLVGISAMLLCILIFLGVIITMLNRRYK